MWTEGTARCDTANNTLPMEFNPQELIWGRWCTEWRLWHRAPTRWQSPRAWRRSIRCTRQRFVLPSCRGQLPRPAEADPNVIFHILQPIRAVLLTMHYTPPALVYPTTVFLYTYIAPSHILFRYRAWIPLIILPSKFFSTTIFTRSRLTVRPHRCLFRRTQVCQKVLDVNFNRHDKNKEYT